MRVCHQGSWPNRHNTEAEYRFAVDRSVNAKSSNVVPGEKSNELIKIAGTPGEVHIARLSRVLQHVGLKRQLCPPYATHEKTCDAEWKHDDASDEQSSNRPRTISHTFMA